MSDDKQPCQVLVSAPPLSHGTKYVDMEDISSRYVGMSDLMIQIAVDGDYGEERPSSIPFFHPSNGDETLVRHEMNQDRGEEQTTEELEDSFCKEGWVQGARDEIGRAHV